MSFQFSHPNFREAKTIPEKPNQFMSFKFSLPIFRKAKSIPENPNEFKRTCKVEVKRSI
jgi:hypothetical protein